MPESMHPHDDADRELAAALRALPLVAPKRRVFDDIAREIARTAPASAPNRWRRAAMAIAATFAVAVIGARWLHPGATTTMHDPGLSPSPETRALIAQSQELDNLLDTLDARSVPIDAGTAMAGIELENLIGVTDAQLNTADNDADARALWSRRVELMSRLVRVRAADRFGPSADTGYAALQPAHYAID